MLYDKSISTICENGKRLTLIGLTIPLLLEGMSYIFVVVLDWALIGIWLAMIIDELFKAVVYLRRWRVGKWQGIRLQVCSIPCSNTQNIESKADS